MKRGSVGAIAGKTRARLKRIVETTVIGALPKRLISAPAMGIAMIAAGRHGEERYAEDAGADIEPFLGQRNMREPTSPTRGHAGRR